MGALYHLTLKSGTVPCVNIIVNTIMIIIAILSVVSIPSARVCRTRTAVVAAETRHCILCVTYYRFLTRPPVAVHSFEQPLRRVHRVFISRRPTQESPIPADREIHHVRVFLVNIGE